MATRIDTKLHNIHKTLFQKKQKELLKLINTDIARSILSIKTKQRIVGVFPNGWKIYLGTDGKKDYFRYQFRCYDICSKYLLPILDKQEIAKKAGYLTPSINYYDSVLHFAGLKNHNKLPQVFSTIYYAGSGDGDALGNKEEASNTWAQVRGQATADSAQYGNAVNYMSQDLAGGSWQLRRMFFQTDTSGIDDGATISAATFYFWPNAKTDTNSLTVVLCKMTSASSSTVVTGDYDGYDSLGSPVEWGTRLALSAVTTGQYNSIAFNASGIAEISKTGFTYVGLRGSKDIDNSAPTGTNNMEIEASEASGTSHDPYLDITTAIAATGGFMTTNRGYWGA